MRDFHDDVHAFKLAIIIPEYNQPQLAIEAIEDALAQRGASPVAVVLANDASIFTEIDMIAEAYQRTQSNFFYLKAKANRGLAGNRNAAVKFCLRHFPNLDALTFLDSDDRLHPRTLQHFELQLKLARKEDARVGWIYTDPYQFGGIHGYLRKPSQYKILWHMLANSNSATSLVDVSVFRSGCFFDEAMKKGSEDWAFWLSAVSKGYIGRFARPPTFGYRRRAESMSSDAVFHRGEIADYVRSKFPELYGRDNIMRLQDAEFPPYALLCVDRYEEVVLASDSAVLERSVSFSSFVDALVEQRADPLSHAFRCVCIAHSQVLGKVIELGLLNWILWTASNTENLGSLSVSLGCKDEEQGMFRLGEDTAPSDAGMIVVPFATLGRYLAYPEAGGVHVSIRLSIPGDPSAFSPHRFFKEVLIPELSKAGLQNAELAKQHLTMWKPHGAVGRDVVDHLLGTRNHLPLRKEDKRPIVGVVAGNVNFRSGNLEGFLRFLQYWRSMEKEFRAVLYLPEDIFGPGLNIAASVGLKDVFFIPRSLTAISRTDEKHYLGSKMTPWMVFAEKTLALGPFCGVDVVFNLALPELSALAFPLRKRGVTTIAVLPADARTSHSRGMGINFRSPVFGPIAFVENVLAFEHAYDYIVTASRDDIPWLISKGLPKDKVVTNSIMWSFDIRRLRNTFADSTVNRTVIKRDGKDSVLSVLGM